MPKKKTKRRKKRKPRNPRDHSKRVKTQSQTVTRNIFSECLQKADSCLLVAAAYNHQEIDDIVFLGNAHFLPRRVQKYLAAVRLLHQTEGATPLAGDDASIKMSLEFSLISEATRKQMVEREIPIESEAPLLFRYNVLAEYLPNKVKINQFYDTFSDLIFNEWKINYGRKLFTGFGFEKSSHPSLSQEQRSLLSALAASVGEQVAPSNINLRTARGLWFASEVAIRIRAQWDKLVKEFLLDRYLGIHAPKTFEKSLRRLEKETNHEYLKNSKQVECLNVVIALARGSADLKEWRDRDLHKFSGTVFGVLDRDSTEHSLDSFWAQMVHEHDRVREAFFAAIGVIILGPQVSTGHIHGRWPYSPQKYPDLSVSEDFMAHKKLVDLVAEERSLSKKIKSMTKNQARKPYEVKRKYLLQKVEKTVRDLFNLQ